LGQEQIYDWVKPVNWIPKPRTVDYWCSLKILSDAYLVNKR